MDAPFFSLPLVLFFLPAPVSSRRALTFPNQRNAPCSNTTKATVEYRPDSGRSHHRPWIPSNRRTTRRNTTLTTTLAVLTSRSMHISIPMEPPIRYIARYEDSLSAIAHHSSICPFAGALSGRDQCVKGGFVGRYESTASSSSSSSSA
jgi:hypothetical protein